MNRRIKKKHETLKMQVRGDFKPWTTLIRDTRGFKTYRKRKEFRRRLREEDLVYSRYAVFLGETALQYCKNEHRSVYSYILRVKRRLKETTFRKLLLHFKKKPKPHGDYAYFPDLWREELKVFSPFYYDEFYALRQSLYSKAFDEVQTFPIV